MGWVGFVELVVFAFDQPLLPLLKISLSDEGIRLELDFIVKYYSPEYSHDYRFLLYGFNVLFGRDKS